MPVTVAPREKVVPSSSTATADPSVPAERAARAGPSANKVLVTTPVPNQKTAWTKARMDVLQLLREAGYSSVALPTGSHPRPWMKLLSDLGRQLGRGGHIVIEYPFEQRKRAYMLSLFCKLRGVKLYAIVHDLDSLRYPDSEPERELAILKLFDGLVSHNATMTSWLRDGGVSAPIVDLNLFDYRSGPGRIWHEREMSSPLKVVCAGNMSLHKAGYIYDRRLGELDGVELSLYGAFFEPQLMPRSPVTFKGVFDPDAPVLDGSYHFGLIWDGQSVESCEGSFGQYMRFNNPHKLSLYMSLGLPVIVWKEAAIAQFVVERGIGVTVGDLRELSDIPARVRSSVYRNMAANAAALSDQVKRGDFMRGALERLIGG